MMAFNKRQRFLSFRSIVFFIKFFSLSEFPLLRDLWLYYFFLKSLNSLLARIIIFFYLKNYDTITECWWFSKVVVCSICSSFPGLEIFGWPLDANFVPRGCPCITITGKIKAGVKAIYTYHIYFWPPRAYVIYEWPPIWKDSIKNI